MDNDALLSFYEKICCRLQKCFDMFISRRTDEQLTDTEKYTCIKDMLDSAFLETLKEYQ